MNHAAIVPIRRPAVSTPNATLESDMAVVGFSPFGQFATAGDVAAAPMLRGQGGLAAQSAAFEASMARAQVQRVADVQAAAPTPQAPTAGVTAVKPPDPVASAAEVDRARRALDLAPVDKPAAAASSGDRILDGLNRVRDVFNHESSQINGLIAQPLSDPEHLLAVQMEVVHFTVLVETASKLVGKSTSALETLMKG